MGNKRGLIERAKRKAKQLRKLRADPRYLKTIGRLKRDGLLDVHDIPEYRGQVFLQDALWAAQIEPRIYELLPAIIARRPKCFAYLTLPDDLEVVVRELKRGHAATSFRGVAAEKYERWSSFIGRRHGDLRVLKSFRLRRKLLEILRELSEKSSKSETRILEEALEAYSRKT